MRGRPTGGINAASRELGISKPDANRAMKVASLKPEAKEAARKSGLDKNRTALLSAARVAAPESVQDDAEVSWVTRELARQSIDKPRAMGRCFSAAI
jgi:hypothetical protein